MKGKLYLLYIALGALFVGASLWVFLSKGKSAKAIRTKYRVGGALITLCGMLSFGSCDRTNGGITCYDPIPPSNYVNPSANITKIAANDSLFYYIYQPTFPQYSYSLFTEKKEELQKGFLAKSEKGINKGLYYFTVNKHSYTGKVNLSIFAEKTNQIKKDSLLTTFTYTLGE